MKCTRNGHICVIYSPGYGAGWYTWHRIEELLYDPEVVKMIEDNTPGEKIEEYCRNTYGDECYLAAGDLAIAYVNPHDRFYIDEYDGAESVVLESEFPWISPI